MSSTDWSRSSIAEVLLAVVVLASATVLATTSPIRLPSGLETGIVFGPPALLGGVSVFRVVTGSRHLGALISGLLGVSTLGLVAWSGLTLALISTGGVFFGGLFVLTAGTALAVTVLVRAVLRVAIPPMSSPLETDAPSDE